ncbi:MAG TPA: hypothetical protein VF859_03295 [Burkholderiales bacterium]
MVTNMTPPATATSPPAPITAMPATSGRPSSNCWAPVALRATPWPPDQASPAAMARVPPPYSPACQRAARAPGAPHPRASSSRNASVMNASVTAPITPW